jgi:uncharacterized protein YjiS (DUF1127 family)
MTFFAQSRPHADRVVGGFQGLSLGALFATLKTWNEARITRKQLHALTDRELADVGLCRADIDRIATRGF